MDNSRFDALVRAIGAGASRRSVLKGLLGLGGTIVVADQVDARTARTRPTIPPPPPPSTTPQPTTTTTPCPVGTVLCPGSTLCCPTGTCARSGNAAICCDGTLGNGAFVCGLECCDDGLQCCDRECCAGDHLCLARVFGETGGIEEEICCPASQTCDGRCCDGVCFREPSEVMPGEFDPFARSCCPASARYCAHASDRFLGLCCSGENPDCCHEADGNPLCLSAGQCCTSGECLGACEVCDLDQHTCVIDPACTTTTAAPTTTTGVPGPTTTTATPTCQGLQSVCNAFAPNCCQTLPTNCSFEANCTTTQGEARCCRPIGGSCSVRCDCCDNADCVGGTCQLDSGQQCLDANECAGADPGCCSNVCRDKSNDLNNCGGCGFVCQSATNPGEINTCIQGSCGVACGAGYCLSGVQCVPLNSDANNCGACGGQCAAGETCCSGQCRNLLTDENSCGQCGALCPGTCCNGKCEDLLIDVLNCGACGHNCFLELCGAVVCGIETDDPLPRCCEGVCVNLTNDNSNCGICGTMCPIGYECTGATCVSV